MAKTLSFTDTSPQTVKIGDTTTSFTMVLGEDSNPVDLTNATSIIAKLGNNSGYLKSQTIPTSSITDPLSGKIVISFDSDFMSGLPAGSYLLEVWVTYSTGVSIYPSNTMTGFMINSNIEDSGGSTITTITFDDFVKELNKAASTIDKGDKGDDGLSAYQVAVSNGYHGSQTDWLASLKGDTGTVDNTGLISSPAFQSLQTQVDNSAVGINLVLGTSSQVVQASNWNMQVADIKYDKSLGDNLCASVMINNADHASDLARGNAYIILTTFDSSGNILATAGGKDISYNANGLSQCSISINDGTADIKAYIKTNNMNQNAFYSCLKIEKGSKATDWCPNPSEILTQADYAKIKAAIVALGGSLS